jgi:hypothetical protein
VGTIRAAAEENQTGRQRPLFRFDSRERLGDRLRAGIAETEADGG